MIPSVFMYLDAIPLKENGKLNRTALPPPSVERQFQVRNAEPRTQNEILIAKIWTEALGVKRVELQDNFFDLGGHSLLATTVISRVRDSFDLDLPLVALFDQPNLAGFAQYIEEALRTKQKHTSLPIQPIPRNQALPLSFAQQRLWFFDQLQPRNPAYNIGRAFLLSGNLDKVALEKSLQQIINRHEILRTTFLSIDGRPFQVVHSMVNVTISLEDLCQLSVEKKESEVKRLALQEANEPFDLASGPLLRLKLLLLGPEEHVLLFTIHHIVFDGWSQALFFRELETLYESFISGKEVPLSTIPFQYADFAYWQRKWLQGKVLENQLTYWKQKLEGAPSVLRLPTDHTRPPTQTYLGANEILKLPDSLTHALKLFSQTEGVTVFVAALAAFKTLIYRYTGQTDIVIGTPIAGRNRSELEELIGFFVNNLPLRTDLSGNPTFRELMHRVRNVALQAFDHQDLPFEKLVEELHPSRDPSYSPVLQVLFNELNFTNDSIGSSGLTLTPILVDTESAKFDLTANLIHEDGHLILSWNYNTDLFERSTMLQMQDHFQSLLKEAVANPGKNISSFSLLATREAKD
jgi:acyl carrier protein